MTNPMGKRYVCHKEVSAAKVKSCTLIMQDTWHLELDTGQVFVASNDWINRHIPVGTVAAGGYVVLYDDGYSSWSPAATFEAGYTELNLDVEAVDGWDQRVVTLVREFEPQILKFVSETPPDQVQQAALTNASQAISAKRTADALTRIADAVAGTQQRAGLVERVVKALRGYDEDLLPF